MSDERGERLHLIISGQVQGVYYRASTQAEAQRLGLRGWVRNLPDGRVELLAEGPRSALDALVAWCWQGPPRARVSGVEARWGEEEPAGEAGFVVRR